MERGAIALGETLVMPDKGLQLAVNLKKIDADFWRRMFSATGEKGSSSRLPRLATSATLKTRELILFGHTLNELELKASTTLRDSGWRAEVKSREMNGELTWLNQGAGRLSARLKQLAINNAAGSKPPGADSSG
ncbi:MAG: hypothetical protein NTY41_16865, partial [Proteobacteria bacterium]|nr:hypothetical protein [Pseudomonadota bacterium]